MTALYATHAEAIRTYVYRRTSDPDLAADLMQETFLRATVALQRGDRVRHASGWLYRIAHNLVIDYYRARDRRGEMELMDLHAADDDSAAIQARVDAAQLLGLAAHRLTPEQATVLDLRELHGYPYGEIARLTDRSEGAVKALRHRALENLRAVVQPQTLYGDD